MLSIIDNDMLVPVECTQPRYNPRIYTFHALLSLWHGGNSISCLIPLRPAGYRAACASMHAYLQTPLWIGYEKGVIDWKSELVQFESSMSVLLVHLQLASAMDGSSGICTKINTCAGASEPVETMKDERTVNRMSS